MIQIRSLTKHFGHVCAVDDISLEINNGEILGLLGPNGAGKTTTLRILTGYLMPSSGAITVKDLSIYDHALEIKKLIGYLPEAAPLYPDMTVYDYLRFVAAIRGLDGGSKASRIRETAGMCGLYDVMHKSIHELSKGYKQRVGLAHAMMSDPEILILDEPTSGLDPNQIVEIRDIIRTIGKHKTVILSTHILSEAEAACDRIVIINKGKIVADNSTEELKKGSGSDSIIHISLEFDDFEAVESALTSLAGVNAVVISSRENGVLHVQLSCRTDSDIRRDVYDVIKQKNWPLLAFYRETRTLEHIFRELTRET